MKRLNVLIQTVDKSVGKLMVMVNEKFFLPSFSSTVDEAKNLSETKDG